MENEEKNYFIKLIKFITTYAIHVKGVIERKQK